MIAVSMNPEDERLKNNLKLIEQAKRSLKSEASFGMKKINREGGVS